MFLAINKDDLHGLSVDFVLVTGDAYVDHPSFGAAVIGRLLESLGYTVGVIAQPDWKNPEAFAVFSEPRLGFLITSGNIDSMVSNYTVAKKRRGKDLYSPGGEPGKRPDRACMVYANAIRVLHKKTPIILGGLEASLRRLAHYDYWDNKVRRSILLDAGADILVYGMGEQPITEIAAALQNGMPVSEITFVKGTVYKTRDISGLRDYETLPSFEDVRTDKRTYAHSFMQQYRNADHAVGRVLAEEYKQQGLYVVCNPSAAPLDRNRFDAMYELPYERTYHPVYESQGGVPAIEEVRFSIISARGCFGGCHFCALAFHQGLSVTSRSKHSIIKEAAALSKHPDFKGYIHDVGGPTANFRVPACQKQQTQGACPNKRCLSPKPCKRLNVTHREYLDILRELRSLPGIKKVFIRSGIRFDYLLYDPDETFFREMVKYHISGQLKVAPEHVSPRVLEYMGKSAPEIYDQFKRKYEKMNRNLEMNQYLVPYFMSSHPGCDLHAAIELAEYLRDIRYTPEQVQDFYPTPGTLSTCMYYTELDPRTMTPVYVAKSPHEKAMQRALVQYRSPNNYGLVYEALMKAGRADLIGFSPQCLIRPRSEKKPRPPGTKKSRTEPSTKKGRKEPSMKKGRTPSIKKGRTERGDRLKRR